MCWGGIGGGGYCVVGGGCIGIVGGVVFLVDLW